jgi:hypothetical protein
MTFKRITVVIGAALFAILVLTISGCAGTEVDMIGVKLVIVSDAHDAEQLHFMRMGIGTARRAWTT